MPLKQSGAAIALALAALTLPAAASDGRPQLVDQTGRSFTLQSLSGTPTVVTFVSAHCTSVCPLIDAQFAQASREFSAAHRRVRLLTITLDPENDPPRVMRALARTFSADPRKWIVASGRVSDVHAVMRMFGVTVRRGRDGYAEVHTTFAYLVDARGRLRATMLASTNFGTQVVADVDARWSALTQ